MIIVWFVRIAHRRNTSGGCFVRFAKVVLQRKRKIRSLCNCVGFTVERANLQLGQLVNLAFPVAHHSLGRCLGLAD